MSGITARELVEKAKKAENIDDETFEWLADTEDGWNTIDEAYELAKDIEGGALIAQLDAWFA